MVGYRFLGGSEGMVPLGCMPQNFTRRSQPCSNLVEMETE